MKTYLHIVFILCFAFSNQAQNSKPYSIIRSNLGISGSSKIINTANGKYSISQSIGQASVIGTHYNNGYYLRQGYQQPLNKIKVTTLPKNNDLTATVYPNPFEETVSIVFTQNMTKEISILVFDIAGKQIYSKNFEPLQRIEVNFDNISSGSYLLKVFSNNKIFNAKLIKK